MDGRILIAEDDYDQRSILADYFNSCGYETLAVKDGQEALHQLAACRFDLLILDLSMPKVDGWAVLSQMRARPETQHLPVIVFSAHAFAHHRERALQSGCNAFLSKPFDPVDLLKEVQRLLGVPADKSTTDSSAI
jgi:CheY-like chemotaxis protein